LGDLQLNQGINFFPKQHYSRSETCNVRKVLRASLTLAERVWVQASEQSAGLFKANKKRFIHLFVLTSLANFESQI
jgi:hypothetical protein